MIALVTMWGGEDYRPIAEYTVPLMREYAIRHGYEFHVIQLQSGNYAFKKHEYFKELMKDERISLIWYLDVDAVITNMNIPISDFVDEEHSFFITRDFNELNGGSVILKNNIHGNRYNEMVLWFKGQVDNEQYVFNNALDNKDDVMILPHPSINSYKYNIYPECVEYVGKRELGDWHPGDFVLHCPGASLETRLETLKSVPIIK